MAVSDFTDTLVAVVNEDIYWTNHSVNLSEAGYNSQDVHIAFVLRSVDGFKFYMDSLHVTKEDPLSLDKTEMTTFTVFPNPTTDKITFNADFFVQKARIKDMNGSLIIETENTEIDVQHLSKGVYFIELVHSGGVTSKRFVKI